MTTDGTPSKSHGSLSAFLTTRQDWMVELPTLHRSSTIISITSSIVRTPPTFSRKSHFLSSCQRHKVFSDGQDFEGCMLQSSFIAFPESKIRQKWRRSLVLGSRNPFFRPARLVPWQGQMRHTWNIKNLLQPDRENPRVAPWWSQGLPHPSAETSPHPHECCKCHRRSRPWS